MGAAKPSQAYLNQYASQRPGTSSRSENHKYSRRIDCPRCGAPNRAYVYGSILMTPCCQPGRVQRFKRSHTVISMSDEKTAMLTSWLDDGTPVGHYVATRRGGAMSGDDRRENLHMRDENSKSAVLGFLAARTAEGWTFEVEQPGPNMPTNGHGACLRYRLLSAPLRLMHRAAQILKRARRHALRAALALAGGIHTPSGKALPVKVSTGRTTSVALSRLGGVFKALQPSVPDALDKVRAVPAWMRAAAFHSAILDEAASTAVAVPWT